jgi:hypothetical protein
MLQTVLMLLSWPWDPPPPPPATLLEEWTPFLISSTGWLGFCLSLLNTQMPTAMLMAITQTINNATYVVHFALVGAWSGLATQVIAMTNGLLKIGAECGSELCTTVQKYTPLALIPLGWHTYSKPLDLLPLCAVAGRLFSFSQKDMFTVRLIQLLALIPWVPYAVALGSQSALATAVLSIVLQCIAIYTNHYSAASKAAAKQKKAK